MTIKWTESSTVKLVILYGRYECLRNPCHPDFNKELCCFKAYKQIVQCMNIPGLTVCDCVKRISFIKKQYCFELSKISAAISKGSFYKPKPSWFEMMHELLFPYIQSESECNADSRRDCDCSQDEEGNGDRSVYENEETNECECPPCECPPSNNLEPEPAAVDFNDDTKTFLDMPSGGYHRSKSRLSKNRGTSKSPIRFGSKNCLEIDSAIDLNRLKPSGKFNKYRRTLDLQTDQGTSIKRKNSHRGNETVRSTSSTKFTQASKRSVDASNRTIPQYISQAGAQTENKTTTNASTSFERAEKAQSTVNYEIPSEDAGIDSAEDKGKRYKHHDEFDMFGKSIAFQLRSMNLESAINLEKRIQDMMTEERLFGMKDNTVAVAKTRSIESTWDYNKCKDCCNSDKDQICACGLPISKCLPPFSMRASQCCGFGCN